MTNDQSISRSSMASCSHLSPIKSEVAATDDSDLIPELFDRINTLTSQLCDEPICSKTLQRTMYQILLRLPPINTEQESETQSRVSQPSSPEYSNQVSPRYSEPRRSTFGPEYLDKLLKNVDIPMFSGVYIHGWISLVERYFCPGGFSDSEKLDMVSVHLAGDALGWFNLEINCLPFETWSQFKKRLLLHFGNMRVKGPS
ncbi:hypothetical protein CARUB_v10007913mg [Capsella rubella]|uniref:Retrotransposon gag domain-containing protein n=1 Tax=Capsella rubella TaxID=81985 RepID=R0EU79_9BRAS|nr:hypothetical protein CARUB_v10007913mg [Capsella rubella]